MDERPIAHGHGGTVSRRGFMECSACAATGIMASLAVPASVRAAAGDVRERVQEFPYGSVQLTGGPLKEHYDRIHAHYLALDNDRLLKVFRQRVGLPAPGPDMGGWYDSDGFVPALTFGQYVSGLARLAATNGDSAAHSKVRALVAGFGEFLARTNNPYAGANSEKMWPAYVMDKYVVGLVDAYRLSGVEQAKAILPQVIEKCLPYISPVSRDRIGKKDPPYDETYVLSENLFAAAEITGNRRYHDLGVHYLLDREWFDPLAAGQDVLPGKHAYSHTIALSSGGKAYFTLGNPKYRRALENAWKFMESQRFASGGWGPEEQFVPLHEGKLNDSLTTSSAHFETPCGSYADTKLARYLMRMTADPSYGDGLERTLFNTILATRLPDSDGDYPYYSSYAPGATKQYYQKKWPCCSGTLVQTVADYVLNVYFHDKDAIWVNMYAPSTVRWERPGGAVELEQVTNYPTNDRILVRVRSAGAGGSPFAVNLRIPAWARGASVYVNGRPANVAVTPGSFTSLHRQWRTGDAVELIVPQPLRTQAIDDRNPNRVAVLRGAVMYVGLNPWDGLDKQPLALPAALRPVAGQPLSYSTHVGGKDLVFVPYFTVGTERYDTYFLNA